MKTKKPNISGYPFAGMFIGLDNAQKWVSRLKKIAKEQHRTVSMQARVFLMASIEEHESK